MEEFNFDFIERRNEIFNNEDNKEEKVIKMLKDCLVYFDQRLKYYFDNSPIANEELRSMSVPILMMIEELLEEQKRKWTDIDFSGSGGYSFVYRLGDRIFKVGKERKNIEIPNSDKILQPLVRKKMNGFGFELFIEITNRVELIEKDDEDDEELYQFWKEFRDEGIIWTDPSYSNLGILLTDNIQEPYNPDPEILGLIGSPKRIRHKGEWVLIDTDYLYRENTKSKKMRVGRLEKFNKFCKRYNKERALER